MYAGANTKTNSWLANTPESAVYVQTVYWYLSGKNENNTSL